MTAKGGVFLNSSLLPLGETNDGVKEMGKEKNKMRPHTKVSSKRGGSGTWGGGGGGESGRKKNQIRLTPVFFEVEAGWERGVEEWGGDGGYVFGKCRRTKTELRSCVKVQVAVAGSPSLIVLKVSVVVWQHRNPLTVWPHQ